MVLCTSSDVKIISLWSCRPSLLGKAWLIFLCRDIKLWALRFKWLLSMRDHPYPEITVSVDTAPSLFVKCISVVLWISCSINLWCCLIYLSVSLSLSLPPPLAGIAVWPYRQWLFHSRFPGSVLAHSSVCHCPGKPCLTTCASVSVVMCPNNQPSVCLSVWINQPTVMFCVLFVAKKWTLQFSFWNFLITAVNFNN